MRRSKWVESLVQGGKTLISVADSLSDGEGSERNQEMKHIWLQEPRNKLEF